MLNIIAMFLQIPPPVSGAVRSHVLLDRARSYLYGQEAYPVHLGHSQPMKYVFDS